MLGVQDMPERIMKRLSIMRTSLIFILVVHGTANALWATDSDTLQFNRDIRPILADHCYACHGFDSATREANLRFDTVAGATAELESGNGYAIVPGKPEQSLLIQRIHAADGDEQMPPAHTCLLYTSPSPRD